MDTRIIDVEQIPGEGACEVWLREDAPETSVIVMRRGEAIHAWRNICPHAGRFLNWAPGRFLFGKDGKLVCAAHGAAFQIEDGLCTDGPCRGSSLVPVTVTRLDDGRIQLSAD